MTDKNPLAHYSGVLSEAVQESAAVPDQAQIKALMRRHRIWIEHSTLLEEDEPARELRAVQAEQHQFEAFVQDLIALSSPQAAPAAVAVPDERAAFEAWAPTQYAEINLARDGDEYRYALAKDWWPVWKASRAALAATPQTSAAKPSPSPTTHAAMRLASACCASSPTV